MSVRDSVPSNGAGDGGTDAVSTAIAEAGNVDVAELESPPADMIDQGTLERVRRNVEGTTRQTSPCHGSEVEVRGNGVVTVTEPSDGT